MTVVLLFCATLGIHSISLRATCRSLQEQKTELESIFSASIKEEVEHTIKTALSEGVDFLGILPRAERALPQLAKACTREQLWERMAFCVVPKVQITDMGRKR